MVVVASDLRGRRYVALRCTLCGSPVRVRWHHVSYTRGFVLPVCLSCHAMIHSSYVPPFGAFAPMDRKEDDYAAFKQREKDIHFVLGTINSRLERYELRLAPPERLCLIIPTLATALKEDLQRFLSFARRLANVEGATEVISEVADLLRRYADELEREVLQRLAEPTYSPAPCRFVYVWNVQPPFAIYPIARWQGAREREGH